MTHGTAAMVTSLVVGSSRGFRGTPEQTYQSQASLLEVLLGSLRRVDTRLGILTMVTTRDAAVEARLTSLGTRILPIAKKSFRPPRWGKPFGYFENTFSKLIALSFVQFSTLIFIDNDCIALRNIDHLATVPTPAFAFHKVDEGLNSGLMVITPNTELAAQAEQILLHEKPPRAALQRTQRIGDANNDFSDQEVWTELFIRNKINVYELPYGFNFRWHAVMSHEERCNVYVSHGRLDPRSGTLPRAIGERRRSCHLASMGKYRLGHQMTRTRRNATLPLRRYTRVESGF